MSKDGSGRVQGTSLGYKKTGEYRISSPGIPKKRNYLEENRIDKLDDY